MKTDETTQKLAEQYAKTVVGDSNDNESVRLRAICNAAFTTGRISNLVSSSRLTDLMKGMEKK